MEASRRAKDDGWAALAEGRWRDARSAFERALVAGETPALFEGLSWAAWWLDDGPRVFEARKRAYHLYRRRGDVPSAARMATWLAADELDFHGAVAVASGWLRRARRLLEPIEPCPAHGWLAFQEGYLAHLSGDSRAACDAGALAADLGRRLAVPDLEMLGLALEGAALVASANVDEGMRLLDEATATALEGGATIPISSAWACCFLVTACTAVRDHERASSWCNRIAEFADQFGSRYMLAFCRSEYGAVYLAQGRWTDAEELLQASLGDFLESRPAWSGAPLVQLAELRRRQGRYAEAARLVDDAGPSLGARICRARLALDRGDDRRAVEHAERALRAVPVDRALERLPALEALVRASIARGAHVDAEHAAAELGAIASRIRTPAIEATALLASGMVAAARGDHASARPLLEDALDRFDACEAPFESAEARVELAVSLAALGRADAAASEAATSVDALTRLGAEPAAARARRVHAAVVRPSRSPVTRRERDVLRLLAEGMTNRQIATRLVVSEHTVHRHVTNLLRKLDLHSRTAAAAYAVRAGLDDDSR